MQREAVLSMYNTWYDIMSYVFLIVRYAASSVLCLNYTRNFFKEKNGRTATFAAWNIMYLLGELVLYFAFNTVNVLQNIICLTAKIVFLMILQRLLFYNGGAANWFTVFSFLVGSNLTVSIISVVVYRYIWDMLFGALVSMSENIELETGNFSWEQWQLTLFFMNAFVSFLAVAGYIAILALYLKIIKKSFRKKDYRLQRKESVFLILPLVASLVISVTMRVMEFNEIGEVYSDIFDVVPVTKLFIPITHILLLCTNIATVILFQSLVEYNEEKNKSDLLESQIAQMRGEITEIQDIYSDIRGLRHDMKNHIENISLYVKRTGSEDKLLSEYIGSMEKAVDRLDFSFNTGDPICDVIIHRKSGEAEKKGIRFKSDFMFPKTDKRSLEAEANAASNVSVCEAETVASAANSTVRETGKTVSAAARGLDPYDIGVILSNSLENAIEACEKAGEGAYIFVRSYVKGSLFFIETENSFSGELSFGGGSGLPLSSKEGESHGYGLSNIERTAKKYMGDIDIVIEERSGKSVFFLTVMLHL